jgi:hypothetical protein
MMVRDGTRSLRSTAYESDFFRRTKRYSLTAVLFIAVLTLSTGTVSAQNETGPGTAFCDTDMAGTIQNLFTIIQFGGPLVGGVLALGATVAMPVVRRSDRKKGLRTIQMQGLLWGVIVAPLGTEIVQFILNNVVVGGTSCGF